MSSSTRNFLLAAGALWGFVLALVPAVVMFASPLSPTVPRLRAALRRPKRGHRNLGRRPVDESGAEPSQKRRLVAVAALRRPDRGFAGGRGRGAAVAGVLSTLFIWLVMTVTMTGFSTATPGAIYPLVSQPSIFLQSAIVARAVSIYALLVGGMLAPFTGLAVNWAVQRGVVPR